jgi:hypothetical protein
VLTAQSVRAGHLLISWLPILSARQVVIAENAHVAGCDEM